MKETIIELITKYSPTVVGIVTTLASVFAFFKKVKTIASNNNSALTSLKKSYDNVTNNFQTITSKCVDTQESIVESLNTIKANNEILVEENNNLKEELESLKTLINDNALLKNQLSQMLRDNREE